MLELRPWLAGTLLVALDRGFDLMVKFATDLVKDLCQQNTLGVGLAFMGAGILLAVMVTHAAHKWAEKRERRVVIQDWRDL